MIASLSPAIHEPVKLVDLDILPFCAVDCDDKIGEECYTLFAHGTGRFDVLYPRGENRLVVSRPRGPKKSALNRLSTVTCAVVSDAKKAPFSSIGNTVTLRTPVQKPCAPGLKSPAKSPARAEPAKRITGRGTEPARPSMTYSRIRSVI